LRLGAIQREIRELEQAASQLQDQVNSCKGRERDHERQKKALKLVFQQAGDKVNQLEDELSKATPDAAAIEVLEEELEQAKDELKRVGDVFVDVEARKAELNEENKTNKQEMDKTSKAVEELEKRLQKSQATVQKMSDVRDERLKEKNTAIDKVGKAQEIRPSWINDVESVKQALAETIEQAKSYCPERVPIKQGETAEFLTNKLHRLAATRAQAEDELGGSQLELLARANEAKRLHKDAMQEFEDIRALRNVSYGTCIAVNLY
jgi:chromosome segregation ATPase